MAVQKRAPDLNANLNHMIMDSNYIIFERTFKSSTFVPSLIVINMH